MDAHLYDTLDVVTDGLRVQLEYQPRANYSLVLSGIPFIRAVVVHNESGVELPSIQVAARLAVPGSTQSVVWSRQIAGPHAPDSVSRLDRQADFVEFLPLLADAVESAPASLELRARSAALPGVEPRLVANLQIGAYNEFHNWPGFHASLAAFVQPNTRSVTTILRAASDHLLEQTGDGALQGYQAGPERSHQIGAAIYEALRARRITYINPPASFERTGQKVRTTGQVLADHFGTCIDLAVLYAACVEAAGLFPVIFMCRNHAFGGFYVEEITGETPTVTQPNSLVSLVELGLIAPVELTGLNPGSDVDFREARRIGSEYIQRRLELVSSMIDIARSRIDGIRPMPHFTSSGEPVPDAGEVAEERPFVTVGDLQNLSRERQAEEQVRGVLDASDDSPARFRNWKRDLLDLSLRNPLLNMPRTLRVMDLIVPDGMLAELDDAVHQGRSVRLTAADAIDPIQQARGIETAADLPDEDVRAHFRAGRAIYTPAAADLHQRQLRAMKREADTLEQETGSNYLYLTFGALVHPKKTGGEARAPLFLLPVRLTGGLGKTPFSIRLDGEEIAQPNLCLLQWLKTTHGLELPDLENPAIDDSGIAIQTVFTAVRRSLVAARLPYRIDETCAIAILRFSTFQIWKDLNENWTALLENPVVRHLVERPGETFDDPAPNGLAAVDEATLRLPIAADGSQMAAVMRAASGQSFVLEGPPGTGKSQTIANLIAHTLALGKTVLFVAEKQAALDVVRRRLDAIGIGAFTLELHGSKQSMKSIRDQLRQALESTATFDQGAWDATDARLRAALTQLAGHPPRIHGANAGGHSLWSAFDALGSLGDGPTATVPQPLLAAPSGGASGFDVASANALAQQFQEAALQIGLRPGYHWLLVGPTAGRALDPTELQDALTELSAARLRLDSLGPAWQSHLGRVDPGAELRAVLTLLDASRQRLLPNPDQAAAIDRVAWREAAERLIGRVRTYTQTHARVIRDLDPVGFEIANLNDLIDQSAALDGARFFRESRRKGVVSQLQAHLAPGVVIPDGEVTTFLVAIRAARVEAAAIRDEKSAIPGLVTADTWRPYGSTAAVDLESARSVARAYAWLHALDARIARALPEATATDVEILGDIHNVWARWLTALGSGAAEFRRWAPRTGPVTRDWVAAWASDEPLWGRDLAQSGALQTQRVQRAAEIGAQLDDLGLATFAHEILSGEIPAAEVSSSLLRGLASASLDERARDGGLDLFDGDAQDSAAGAFIAQSRAARVLQTTRLATTILAHRPFEPGQIRGEVAELRRQLDRKRGGLSFRELVGRYPQAITSITPCFLMSPGSVAHFLDAGSISFDLVIFDEASQIRVPQAIGSMGRGKAVVVVGDSRQMPPTRVMQVDASANDAAPEAHDELVVEDLESILSEAVESGLPQEWLTWHYRSQDESLIAFSNTNYYDGKLVSLPSPGASAATGLAWRRVDGVFDRGRGRTNEVEANAIVDEIRSRLRNPATRDDSIGVVCFNIQQRDLILNKLEDSGDPLVLGALTAEAGDAIFVKNLENVQGDERDTILFSLAFSKDKASGKLPLNFGPLNSAGGERRLNVAVTRARKQVVLFSSFDPADIELARTAARGIHDLRRYLEFAAARAAKPTDAAGANVDAEPHGRLVSELADALRGMGYEVAPNLGLSSFKVDLAVRKPGAANWKLAVMVDGPGWSSRPTVVDRDGSPQLLADIMQWPGVARVWLPGWLRDRMGVLERLQDMMERPELETTAPPAPESIAEPIPAVAEPVAVQPRVTARVAPAFSVGLFTAAGDGVMAPQAVLSNLQMAEPAIKRYAVDILTTEGPTQLNRLTSIIARRFGYGRIGGQRRADIEGVIRAGFTITGGEADFVWPPGVDPDTWGEIRGGGSPAARTLQEVSPHELVNAMTYLLRQSFSMSREDLERESLTLLGYTRMTESARSWLAVGVEMALASGRVVEADGRFRVADANPDEPRP